MNQKTDKLKYMALIVFLLQALVLVVLQFFFNQPFSLLAAIFTLVDAVLVVAIFLGYEKEKQEKVITISRVLGNNSKDAMVYGQIGLIIYDNEYVITWVSDLFEERELDLVGEKVTRVFPGSEVVLNGTSDTASFNINDREYEVTKSETEQALFIKDVTELNVLKETYNNEKTVLGLIHLDNYEETIQYEDEQKIALINTNIRQKVIEWGKGYGVVIRRLRSDRFIAIVNEQNFKTMVADRFNILEVVKEEAENLGVAITVSMTFAYGISDLTELDSMNNDLLELVFSRGGDQVAVRKYGDEIKFYGTSSEASEKSSKVKARVIAQTLRGIIKESDQVFVVPHKDADFDAIGSCLGISKIAQSLDKHTYIILNGITIEDSARSVLEDNIDELNKSHLVISEQQAIELLTKDSVVIACDHHSADLTSCPELVAQAKRVAIIDHHRRKTEANISAMMIYNEPSSSSAVELVSELIQYQSNKIELSDFEATYMYTGLLVDTDGFKSRCSSRSFEVCAFLKKEGADIALANEWLKETIEQFETKTKVLKYSKVVNGNILIAALPEKEGKISRTTVAQVANYALTIKEIEAAFVIAKIEDDSWGVSGRSNGDFNVQLVLEQMGGGGHFTAAGLQRQNTTVKELADELDMVIDKFLKGEEDESNTIK